MTKAQRKIFFQKMTIFLALWQKARFATLHLRQNDMIFLSLYIYIYIYIERERERDISGAMLQGIFFLKKFLRYVPKMLSTEQEYFLCLKMVIFENFIVKLDDKKSTRVACPNCSMILRGKSI